MARKESVQSGGIVFGDWKLMPVDSRNWELCKLGESCWRPLGRFYQFNTFDLALQYAADCEMKNECHDREMELADAIAAYRTIVAVLRDDVRDAISRIAKGE